MRVKDRQRVAPLEPAKRDWIVNLANGIGLVLAFLFTAFLVVALIFPEKF